MSSKSKWVRVAAKRLLVQCAIRALPDRISAAGASDQKSIIIILADHITPRRALARAKAMGRVECINVHGDVKAVGRELAEFERPRVIVDLTCESDRLALLRETVWALDDAGMYAIVAPGRNFLRTFARLTETRPSKTPNTSESKRRKQQELTIAVGTISTARGIFTLSKRGKYYYTTRHTEVEAVLSARHGEDWGRVLERKQPYCYGSRAEVFMHGEPSSRPKQKIIEVPELAVREYRDAVVQMREISSSGNLLLPETFRHWQSHNLFHKRVHSATAQFGRLNDEVSRGSTLRAEGAFYNLDSAFPTHFGHLMTETIAKLWGWKVAQREFPEVRPVMTHQKGKAALPAWKGDVLRAAGIPVDQILFVQEGDSVHVDSLIAAMPQLENPNYIDLGIRDHWAAISATVTDEIPPGSRKEKIFVTRRGRSQRECINASELERFFESQGFTVVLPERHSFFEQVQLFRHARIIAGFGGSGLFNAMFNSTARLLILTSSSYVAANEYLIASVNGNEIHYFWAPPLISQPTTGFSTSAYRSGFEFPISKFREELKAAIC